VPTVDLFEKLPPKLSIKPVEAQIQLLCEGLKVKIKFIEVTNRGWIRISVSGEDEVAALSLIEKEFDTAPAYAKNIREDSIYSGKILASAGNATEIYVDLGVFLPSTMDATVSLQHLQAQLVDGKKSPLQKIMKLFCFLENSSLEVLINYTDAKRKCFVAELSERQISRISSWTHSNLDRLIVLRAFKENVEDAVKASGHFRDVVEVESLGMLEHAVICKLGTNAVGLIPKLGRLLPSVVFGVFSPNEILRFIEA